MKNLRWHRQNLNEGGSGFWDGRAWLDIKQIEFCFNWSFGKFARHCGLYIGIGGKDGITLHVGIPYVINLWLSADLGLSLPYEEYQTGVTAFEEFIWIFVWKYEFESRKAWLYWTIDWKKLLLGKQSYEKVELESFRSHLVLPEGDYPCTIKLSRSTWKRPRWKAIVKDYATFIPDKPMAIPGKGEDIWNMDDDAIMETSRRLEKGQTVSDLANEVARDVAKHRERYGGRNWQPDSTR